MSWNWPLYSRECLLYWLPWRLVVKTSSLTVKMTQSALRYFQLWRWRHIGTVHWSYSSVPTDSGNSTCECLQNPKYSDYRPLFTTEDEWTILSNDMEVLRPFRYWILWMSKRHTVTLHHDITMYKDMFHLIDGVMWALAKKKTQWKEDLFFAVKLAWQKLSKYYSEVTAMTVMLNISAHILDPFRKLQLFRKWYKGMEINPEDETSYTTQYQEAFLKDVKNDYCAKHRHVPVNKLESLPSSNLFPTAMASGSCQSFFDSYELSSKNEEYLMSNNVTETTSGRIDRTAALFSASRLYLNSAPDTPENWGKLFKTSMITTPTQWRLSVHFGYRT